MISQDALNILFLEARTHSKWQDKPVPDSLLKQAYNLAKMGPTSANCQPMRILFIRTPEAKERLRPCLAEGNVKQTVSAPVTAIIAHDMTFYEKLPTLFPHTDARSWFAGNDTLIESTAFRNGSLQGAYFILAARALGLDCGPMSGFNAAKLDAEFFKYSTWRSNFLCNLGYGIPETLHPRSPRPDFDDMCRII
ncbi:MAG: malonic semialdehyde reductase [Rickettsiales bacterium]|nr:malonic semialdehyde reductase [Rickettsiales bacterium]